MKKFIQNIINIIKRFWAHIIGQYLLLKLKLKYLRSEAFRKKIYKGLLICIENLRNVKNIIIYNYRKIKYYLIYFFRIIIVIPRKMFSFKYLQDLKRRRFFYIRKKGFFHNGYQYISLIYYYFFGVIGITLIFIEEQYFYNYHRFKNRIKYSKKFKKFNKFFKPLLKQFYKVLKFLLNVILKVLKLLVNSFFYIIKFIFKCIIIYPIKFILSILFLIIYIIKIIIKFILKILEFIFLSKLFKNINFFLYKKKKKIYINFIKFLRFLIINIEFSIQRDKFIIKDNKDIKDIKESKVEIFNIKIDKYITIKEYKKNIIIIILNKLFFYVKLIINFFFYNIIYLIKFIIFVIKLIKERIIKIIKPIIKFLKIIFINLDKFIRILFRVLNIIYKVLKKVRDFFNTLKFFLKKKLFSKIKFDFYFYRDLILLLTIIYPFIIYPIKELIKIILYRYIINPFIYNISDLKRINKSYDKLKENIKQNYNFLKIFLKIWYKSIPLGMKLAISEYNSIFRETFQFRRQTDKSIEVIINKYIYTLKKNSNKVKHEVLVNRKVLFINIKIYLKTYIQKLLIYLNKLINLRVLKKFFIFLKECFIKAKNFLKIFKSFYIKIFKKLTTRIFYIELYYFLINLNPIEILIIFNKLKDFIKNLKFNIRSKLKIKPIILNLKFLNDISFKNFYFLIKPFIRWFIIIHISIIFGATMFFTFFYLGDWFRMLVFDIYSCLMAFIHLLIWLGNKITFKYLNINALRKVEKKTIENDKGITQLNTYLGNLEDLLGLHQVSGVTHILNTKYAETDWLKGRDWMYTKIYYTVHYDVVIFHDQILQEKWMQRKLQGLYETAFNTESIFNDYNNYLYFKIFMDYFQSKAFGSYMAKLIWRLMVFLSFKRDYGITTANSNNYLTEKILYKTEKKQHLRRREKKKKKFILRGISLKTFESKSDELRKESLTYKIAKLLFGEEIILTNRAFMARYWELSLKHKKEMMYRLKTYKDRQTFYNEFLRGDFNNEISKIFRDYNEQKEEKMKKLFFLWMKKKQEINKLQTIKNINNERDKYNTLKIQLEEIIEKTNKIFNNSISLNIIKSEYLQLLNKSLYYKIYLRLLNGEKFVNVKNERRLVLPYSKYLSPEPFNLFKFSNNITNIKLEKDYISKLNSEIKNIPLLRHNSKIIYNVNLINKSLMQLKFHYRYYRNTIPIDNALQIILQKELYRFFLRRFLQNIDLKDLKETSSINYEELNSKYSFPTHNFFGIRSFPIPNMDSNYSTLQTKEDIINKDIDNFFLENDIHHDNFSYLLVDMRGWYPIRRIWKNTINEKKIILLKKLETIIRNEKINKKIIQRRNVQFRLRNKFISFFYLLRRNKIAKIHYRKMYLRKLRKNNYEYYGTLKRFDKSYYGRIRTTVHKTYGASVYFSRSILRTLKVLFGYTPGIKYSDKYLEEAREINLRTIFFKELAKYRIKRDRLNILKDNELTFNLRNSKYLSKSNKELRESIIKKYRVFKVKRYYLNKLPNKQLIKELDEYSKKNKGE